MSREAVGGRGRGPRGARCGPGARLRLLLLLLAPALVTAGFLYRPVPGLEGLRRDPAGTLITDRHGEPLACLPGPEGAFQWELSREDVSAETRRIFLRVEDRRFDHHPGVDLLAAARAAALNLACGRTVSGASTISMQLARLVRPHRGGLGGKLAEALTAVRLEAQLGKREVLRLYLNHLPFGRNTVGLGAAAVRYFDRPVAELTPAQLLILATIPRAPARYDPFAAPAAVLERAAALGPGVGVSRQELVLALASCRRGEPPAVAPHFVRMVTEGLDPNGTEAVRVITTLDAGLYRELRRVVREELARSARVGAAGAAGPVVEDAGALALGSQGEVLAWVGSPREDVFLDAVTIRASTGSTLKPFLYALALEKGYNAASLLPDLPLSFGMTESYRPANFDRKSRAAVRLRTALASSLNVPAVHLLSRLGLEEFVELCRRLGFGFPEDAAARYGLGAAIGNADATLLELTRAFSVFPNRGVLQPLRLVRGWVAADGSLRNGAPGDWGQDALGPADAPRRIFREDTAWLIGDILSDPAARATGFGASSRFNRLPGAMFKSGTSSGYESLWCLGATARYTVGVWAGNLDGRASFGTTGSSLPAAVALAALEMLEGTAGPCTGAAPPEARPATLRQVVICTASGYPASAACPSTRVEFLPAGSPGDSPAGSPGSSRAGSPAGSPRERRVCPLHGAGADGAGVQGVEWLGGVALADAPLRAELLAPCGGGPRILFPLPEQRFYRDRGIGAGGQRLEAWIAAPPQLPVAVRVTACAAGTGAVSALEAPPQELQVSYPFRVNLPLEVGTYIVEIRSPEGSDSVRYHVR
ncbi:MAG: transglycosylase domain-containing protein [Spirochaetales bacterium]|nr:transglycosylase domain-containing protein [Spirochaetales bacterium]